MEKDCSGCVARNMFCMAQSSCRLRAADDNDELRAGKGRLKRFDSFGQ
jgi:hypothetical protein